jgi:hypothetical protein
MSQPTFVAAVIMNETNPTTGGTFTVPTVQIGDEMEIQFMSRNHTAGTAYISVTDNDSGGSPEAWVMKGENATNRRHTLWRRKATANTSGVTVTITGAVNSCAGVLVVYRGTAAGDPIEDFTPVGLVASGTESIAGITPTSPDAMVCFGYGCHTDDIAISSQSTTDPGALTERAEMLSTGGSDCSVSHASAAQTGGPTATGNFTWAGVDAACSPMIWTIKGATSGETGSTTEGATAGATFSGKTEKDGARTEAASAGSTFAAARPAARAGSRSEPATADAAFSAARPAARAGTSTHGATAGATFEGATAGGEEGSTTEAATAAATFAAARPAARTGARTEPATAGSSFAAARPVARQGTSTHAAAAGAAFVAVKGAKASVSSAVTAGAAFNGDTVGAEEGSTTEAATAGSSFAATRPAARAGSSTHGATAAAVLAATIGRKGTVAYATNAAALFAAVRRSSATVSLHATAGATFSAVRHRAASITAGTYAAMTLDRPKLPVRITELLVGPLVLAALEAGVLARAEIVVQPIALGEIQVLQ